MAPFKNFFKRSEERKLAAEGGVAVDRLSDEEFLDHIYKKLLGREPDPVGRAHQLKFLRAGNSRAALVLNLTEAPEFIFKIVKDNIHAYIELLPIKDERPDRYEILSDRWGREKSWVFRVREESDFDWLERKILENGYYERPGVWSFIDIFEHFNPRRLAGYLGEISRLTEDGGFLFVNIPAYGKDKVFGEIFPVAYPEWDADITAGRCFRTIPVDSYGYPKNGHLICGSTAWWVEQFERQGFRRKVDLERALHNKFDAAMDKVSPARKSFYFFSRGVDGPRTAGIIRKISSGRPES